MTTMALEMNISILDFFDQVAHYIASGFMEKRLSWEFGDVVMNNIYTSAYVFNDICLSEFAYRVFEAFDEGEYIHPGEPENIQGEVKTIALLTAVFSDLNESARDANIPSI